MTKQIAYWDYDETAPVRCSECGWVGPGLHGQRFFRELLDVTCPECDRMLLVVPFPTTAETRAAAEAGNQRARAELGTVEAIEARQANVREQALTADSELPEIGQDEITIVWDLEGTGFDVVTVLRHEGREIWREPAFFEGIERFEEVARLLRARYGKRLVALEPSPASTMYLYGDRLSAPRRVEAVNRGLRG